jgi:hypothetical protein
MIRSFAVLCVTGLALAGCASPDPRFVYTDRDCLNRQVGSRVLATAAGIGLSIVAGPAGGLVGMGVGLASDPRCQAHFLTPEGREQLRRDMERERALRGRRYEPGERVVRPVIPPHSARPLDNVPSSSPSPAN